MSTRWEVLYTKQKTQKRKKFQDGVVVMMVTPAGLRKAYLFDENSKSLEEKILKQNETFKDGVELEFNQYLVQVGSCTKGPANASTGSKNLAQEGNSPSKKSKSSTNGQRRTVPQIMERLQKPARAEENHAYARQTTQETGSISSSGSLSSKFTSDVNTASAKSIRIRNFKPPQVDKKLVQPPVQFTFRVGAAPIQRQVVIPDSFSDLASYRNIMSSAMIEEINLIISEFANRFNTAREKLSTIRSSRPSCKHGPGMLCNIRKEGVNNGRWFYSCSSKSSACLFSWADVGRNESDGRKINCLSAEELEQAFDCCGINFYGSCELSKRKFDYQKKHMCSEQGFKPGFISMRLGRLTGPLNHSKGDLWVIGSNANFLEEKKDDFVIVATSESYGSSRNVVTELQLLGKTVCFEEGKKVYALKGPNIASEMSMLDCIRKLETSSTPLLPLLLGSTAYRPKQPSLSSDIDDAVKAAILKYKLNNDQARVLFTVSQWFISKGTTSVPDVCLIHGPFGSGKSHLLVVLMIFLSQILKDREDTSTRFIISAATNSAVDRVLTGLLEHGFDDFLRVGCLSKISSKILPYSIHAASKTGMEEAEAEKDLKEILKDAVGNTRLKIEKELKALRDGKMNYRMKRLKQVRVVGVTCCSTINKVLQGNTFQVCFLDECSQILEPLSLLPICQFRCEKLIAVGDPEQLPPVLSRAAVFASTSKKDNDENGIQSTSFQNLSRTLFVRLATLGHKPILLCTQYRCHPRLALVPNRLFYGGSLLDGCRESERPPLLPSLRPLVFCDTREEGRETKDLLNSYSNNYEAEIACSMIKMMIARGISGCQIGVIVLYKSQEALIRQMLYPDDERAEVLRTKKISSKCFSNSFEDLRVSTVDAFQGLEKDIIILSCCRTNGLGFLASPNRLNVALTRARHHLIIIGKASNLQNNGLWQELLEQVRRAPSCFKSTEDMRRDLEKIDDEQDIKATASIQAVDKPHGNYCLDITDASIQEMESKTGIDNEQARFWEEHYAQLSPKSFLDQKQTPFGKQSKESNTVNTFVKTQLTGEANLCSAIAEEALDAVNFRPQDFWKGYKLYCLGHYSHSIDHQNSFSHTLMADVLRRIYGEDEFQWGPKFDQKVRSSWCSMEEYIKQRYGVDCTDIRFLIEEYDDPEQLAATEHGSIFLDLCEDDTVVPQAKECSRIEDGSVVDDIMGQLSNMDMRLAKLMNKNRKSTYGGEISGEISQQLEGIESWQHPLGPTFDLGF